MDQREISLAIIRELPQVDPIAIDRVVGKVFHVIMAALANGHEVNIPDFGKFVIHTLKQHHRKHPFTQQEIEVLARKQVKFVPSRYKFREVLKRRS